jgi:protein-S-isoprenylcysteine O-methyltransferase Ste14
MLLFGRAALLPYAIVVWGAFHVFVVYFEERRLSAEFPEEYEDYFRSVPRWLPRLTPWRGKSDA